MTIVAVCIYNRFENLKTWIRCWQQSNTDGAELVIIHNYYSDEKEKEKYQSYCKENSVKYVPRNGQGFDVGGFQDVCKERLEGFPNDWDFIIWCTDDCLPMSKDFIRPFINKLQEKGTGVSCMQISKSTPGNIVHVRTTGFCLSKEISLKLKFPADPMKTKQDCYLFEHRGGKGALMEQIHAMGLSCKQVSDIKISPLWDSQHPNRNLRLDRQAEFNRVWETKQPEGDKIVFICPIYNEMYPMIAHSLKCQTHKNWYLLLIHNGPLGDFEYDIPKDKRINFIIYPEATGYWGHKLRQWALSEMDKLCPDANYVCISNADNYHAPTYCEYLLNGFKKNPSAKAVFCDGMVHNYKAHQHISCRPHLGYIDCAGVMVQKDVAVEIGWRDITGHSTDWTYFSDIISRYGMQSFHSVKGTLLVHN